MTWLGRLLTFLVTVSLPLAFSYADGYTTKRGKIAAPYEAPEQASWTGFYAGVHGSWLAGIGEVESGGALGGHIGWQQQWPSNLVLGIEADIEKIWASAMALHCDEATVIWSSTLRARVGYAVGRLLPYATAGAGIRAYDVESSGTEYVTSFVYGAGLEYKVTPNSNVRLEYLRWEAGDQDLGKGRVDLTDNVLRLGYNWSF